MSTTSDCASTASDCASTALATFVLLGADTLPIKRREIELALGGLARRGTVDALRILDAYRRQAHPRLQALALRFEEECHRRWLESELSIEPDADAVPSFDELADRQEWFDEQLVD